MEIQLKTQTTVVVSAQDVEQIVTEYLENHGYTVCSIYPQIKTVYTAGDYPSEEFDGFRIIANVTEIKKEIS
jgi:predicted CoA-binding protein